jgi:hypothetical protein
MEIEIVRFWGVFMIVSSVGFAIYRRHSIFGEGRPILAKLTALPLARSGKIPTPEDLRFWRSETGESDAERIVDRAVDCRDLRSNSHDWNAHLC